VLDDETMAALVLIRHSVRFGSAPEADYFVTVDADGDVGRVEFGAFDRLIEAGHVETDGEVVRATERGRYYGDKWEKAWLKKLRRFGSART
jgi:hypothetical protein